MKYLTTVLFALTLAACGAPVNTEEGDAGAGAPAEAGTPEGPSISCVIEAVGGYCVDLYATSLPLERATRQCTSGYGGRVRQGLCPTTFRVGTCFDDLRQTQVPGQILRFYSPGYTTETARGHCRHRFVPN